MSRSKPEEVLDIERTLDRIDREKPSLAPISGAFRELLVSTALIKSRMPDGYPLPLPEPGRHIEGLPILTAKDLARLADPWGESTLAVIEALVRAFPGIRNEVRKARKAFESGDVDLGECIEALMEQGDERIAEAAARIGVQTSVLRFIVGQILKPFVERRTGPLRPEIRKIPWHRGYCPICGCFPEITFLQGEGQRWLRCSLCGYEWQFNRMLCPSCETECPRKNLIFIEGRPQEYAELCDSCRRYLVGLDIRAEKGQPVTAASAIGLIIIDIMAQEKGYSPLAECAWNVLGRAEA